VDNLLWSFLEWREHNTPGAGVDPATEKMETLDGDAEIDDWDDDHIRQEIEQVREHIRSLRDRLADPAGLRSWDADFLRGRAREIGRNVGPKARERHADAVAKVRAEAEEMAGQVAGAAAAQEIRGATTKVIHSASSVQSIYRAVDLASGELERRGQLTDELRQVAREAKERAARHRWQKRRDDADVAEAGGNAKKAARLRAEAGAMLGQDWPRAFPGESAPAS
jgi:hypothetical protein